MDEWTVFRLTPEEIAKLADAADTAATTDQGRHYWSPPNMVTAPKSDARTPAHGRAGAHAKSSAKQMTPSG